MKRYLVIGISLVSLVLLACSAAPTPTPTPISSMEQYELWARESHQVVDIIKAWAIQHGTAKGKAWVAQATGQAIQMTTGEWEVELKAGPNMAGFIDERWQWGSDTFRYYPKTGLVAPIDAPHTFH